MRVASATPHEHKKIEDISKRRAAGFGMNQAWLKLDKLIRFDWIGLQIFKVVLGLAWIGKSQM